MLIATPALSSAYPDRTNQPTSQPALVGGLRAPIGPTSRPSSQPSVVALARAWLPQPVIAPPVIGSVDAQGRTVTALITGDAIWGLVIMREPGASSWSSLFALGLVFAVIIVVAKILT